MTTRRPRIARRFSLTWLLWLALVLPLAQSAASWHALSHVSPATAAGDNDKQAPHLAHCDLCLAASAIGSGGLLSAAPALPQLPAAHVRPAVAALLTWHAPLALPYRSRAPPFSPR